MKKITLILITTLALTLNSYAGSNGELLLKKNDPTKVKECFEKFNRVTFAFNQSLDGAIFKPLASAYKTLPSPIKSGVSNSLSNLSNLVTIPNNLLQGEFKKASVNTGRFAVNTTLGLPFIRTSPDHGTGFDIAGKGLAQSQSMVEAIKAAFDLTKDSRLFNAH